MIKIGYISDLHGSLERVKFCKEHLDVLVLAGDIFSDSENALRLIEELRERLLASPKVPILYVLGNHEYYNSTIEFSTLDYKRTFSAIPNTFVLEKDSIIVKGTRFLGTTLWSDLSDPVHAKAVSRGLNDFNFISETNGSRISSKTYHKMWKKAASWLKEQLDIGYEGKTAVITHHSPSNATTPVQYKQSSIRKGFHSDMDNMIIRYRPDLWIYGHDHVSSKHKVGNTIIISNQAGYLHERGNERIETINL